MGKFDLGEFLANSGVNIDTDSNREQIEYISIDLIVPDPNNFYALSAVDDLAANISLCGLQQPLRVRPMSGDDSQVIILSGHRRHAALQKLVADGEERFRDVPCIVERGDENPHLTQLKLIYANASTRVLSAAELASQAEQVEQLLYQLKEDGLEFPGRMRDHVAQACKVSTGKLARLKVIRSKLIPQLMRLWESDKLNEGVAYTLAGQPAVRQKAIYLAQTKEGTKPFNVPEWVAKTIIQEMDKVEKICSQMTCEANFTSGCDHKYTRLNQAAAIGAYQRLSCRGCCKSCTWLSSCRYSCEYAATERKRIRDDLAAGRKAAAEEKRAEEAPKKAMIEEVYRRVGARRAELGVNAADFVKTSTGWNMLRDAERLPQLEAGNKIALTDRLPGGLWPDEAKRLCETADLLDCSLDYLLGRSDKPKPAGWQTGTPPEPGDYAAKITWFGKARLEIVYWTGAGWKFCADDPTELPPAAKVLAWIAEPEVE